MPTQSPATLPTPNKALLCSVIIPTLNEQHFLPSLLNDLVRQSDQSFEVIVTDGGSTDQTIEKARAFADRLPGLRVLKGGSGNVAHQRNRAAREAHGTYLIFLDADSRLPPEFVHRLRQVAHVHPRGLYITYFHPDSDSVVLRLSYWLMNQFVCVARAFPRPLSSVGSVVVAKHVFDSIGGYDEGIYVGEDHNLVRRAKHKKWPVFCSHTLRVTFSLRRIRQEGMLRSLYILFFGIGYALIKGDIRKKYFSYEMGGAQYEGTSETTSAAAEPQKSKR